MRNIKDIASNISNVKHAGILHIARIKDYKSNSDMPKSGPQPSRQAEPKEKERSQQAKINAAEEQRLNDLAVRFQKIVVERNARLGEKGRGDVENPDLVHAGLIALERTKNDEDFYKCVTAGKNRL
jgi:hypothetical protein